MTHLAAPGGASLAYACLRPPGDPHGVTGLAASPCGSLLAVSYAKESCVRLFDPRRPSLGPLHLLRGHRADGFYVKVAFSPCGDYLLCGSSDHLARVYRVPRGRDAAHRAIVLEGHAGEVSAVAWCQAGVPQLSTASDDGTVRVWSPSRSESRVSRSYAADVAQEAAPVDVFTPGFRAPSRRSTDSARVAPSPGGSAGVAAPATTPMSGGPIAQERPDAHGATPPMLQVMSLVSAGADARERVGGERGEPRTPVAGAGGPELQRGDVWAGGTTPGAGEGAGGTGKEVGGSSADGDALRTVAVRPVAEGERTRKRARQSTLELFFCSAGRQADQAD